MKKYDKLVRDFIPDIIAKKGTEAKIHIAEDAEYHERLRTKLQEEVAEFLESENPEELADILEVIYALGDIAGLNKEGLEAIRKAKADERGGFGKRVILEEA